MLELACTGLPGAGGSLPNSIASGPFGGKVNAHDYFNRLAALSLGSRWLRYDRGEVQLAMATTDPIAHYIEEGPGGARLRESGVEIWALVAQLPAMDGNVARLAAAYGLPAEVVQAAPAYYQRHKELIDAQIALNTV